MDTQFIWNEENNIGVDIIDKEHQRLFNIINKLFALKEEGKDSRRTCYEGIKFFKSHAIKHFADEEEYMKSIGYDGYEQHKSIHDSFRKNTLPTLEKELENTNYSTDAVEHFLGVCSGWLVGHTLTEDAAITGKSGRRWENLLPDEEIDAIRKVIIQLVFDMFHLESQMISDVYGGEKFGNGIYYRLVYGKKNEKKKQEVILVFEEKLLINTVGKVIGVQTNKLDNMLLHATRITAKQFVSRIMKHLQNMEGYELEEENLLSYEKFKKVFENEKFQVSLLFNTSGSGYFAYCAIAPHLLEDTICGAIEPKNAVNEIEKYLAEIKESEGTNKKILVVDDSLTICQGMKQLLEKDYEVNTANSGVAAIRAITLNVPDLVLLDYEMPVCDGRQTLEMLRSEKAFENVPVIFLTGRRDPESMIKVMPLKPAGYLLKNSKLEDIKKEIDDFFKNKNS